MKSMKLPDRYSNLRTSLNKVGIEVTKFTGEYVIEINLYMNECCAAFYAASTKLVELPTKILKWR